MSKLCKYIIFGPTFPASDMMFDDIKNDVDVIYDNMPVKYKWGYLCLRIHLNKLGIIPFKKIWRKLFYINKKEIDSNNSIFIYCNPWYQHMYTTGFFDYLKKIFPNSKHIIYLTDINSAREFLNSEIKSKFDNIFIFDKHFSEEEKIGYYPLMCSTYQKGICPDEKWQVVFIGQAKGRLEVIRPLFQKFLQNGIRAKCIITNYERDGAELDGTIEYKKAEIDPMISLNYLMKSSCVLELKSLGVDALSDRITKAIVNNKKILTNNKSIVNHKYYDEKFIQIFDNVDEIEYSFFDNSYVDYHYSGDYSPRLFLEYIGKEEKRNDNI